VAGDIADQQISARRERNVQRTRGVGLQVPSVTEHFDLIFSHLRLRVVIPIFNSGF